MAFVHLVDTCSGCPGQLDETDALVSAGDNPFALPAAVWDGDLLAGVPEEASFGEFVSFPDKARHLALAVVEAGADGIANRVLPQSNGAFEGAADELDGAALVILDGIAADVPRRY